MKKALLIIDMQRAFFKSGALDEAEDKLVAACNQLMQTARAHDCPVVMVRTVHQTDGSTWTLNMHDDQAGFLLAGEADTEYLPRLDTADAKDITKTRDSAFWQTNLLSYLRQHGVEAVVLAGVSTHLCIAQTANDAYNANLRVELAIEAIASDKPELHEAFLQLLHQEYRMQRRRNHEIDWSPQN